MMIDEEGWYIPLQPPGSAFLRLGIDGAPARILCSDAESLGVEKKSDSGWQEYPLPEEVLLTSRMHLSRDDVAHLVNILQHWLENGHLKPVG